MTKGWIKDEGHECHEFLDEVHECLIWIAGVADENILDMHLKRILENIRHVLQVWTLKSTFIGLHVTWASQLLHLHRTTHSFWLACNILCGNEEFKWYPAAAAAMFPAYYEFILFPFGDLDAFIAAIIVSIAFSFIPASLVVAIMKTRLRAMIARDEFRSRRNKAATIVQVDLE
ncbi:unnamed protein product [Lactuca saligna]|uniref:Uncharacterized protein n=1 Tax=Lactuca saligna TaxID=75948 RepID=A0AA35Z1W1_LACSI|nr:unnamed protein product [Lactuca saligna]